jgi:SAM-dependent methyltransferase
MSTTQLSLDLGDITNEGQLVGAALALGAREVPGWSAAEEALARTAVSLPSRALARLRDQLRAGGDPLGDAFCTLRSPEERRPMGATYTPQPIVEAMLAWRSQFAPPTRVVDPGTGSGRYLVAAGRMFSRADLVGIEIDPLAAMIARAVLAASGLAGRARIEVSDFRAATLPRCEGATFFVGNPPYVRHHLISEEWKQWLSRSAAAAGCASASQLAGLHVHFFLATLGLAQAGDRGAYVTAAEWLDVNYGKLVRDLLLGRLGGTSVHVIEPTAQPFPDAATTAAITCFEVGARPSSLRLRRVEALDELGSLDGGRPVRRERLEAARRWSPLTRAGRRGPEGYVELGELCRVHRGAVTGANKVWIADALADLPASVLFPSVTKARELFHAGGSLADPTRLRRVIDLPVDLDVFDVDDRKRIDRFLRRAKALGAHSGYVAQNRRAWWSVGLREPAPILATYMARRPPAFVRNLADARHINIAHGLYPRERLAADLLDKLARHLSTSTSLFDGRTYAGGLTKFEPREMERLLVPGPALLAKDVISA